MFAIIENTLRALPNSLKLNGVIYTDLWTQSDSDLSNLGIYKLPDPPAYDCENFKLSVNYGTKQWEILPLTPEEKAEALHEKYLREFKKLEGKYKSYLVLYESKKEDLYMASQLETYILDLLDYMFKIYNQEIPLSDIKDYPDCILCSRSNNL